MEKRGQIKNILGSMKKTDKFYIEFPSKSAYNLKRNILLLSTVTGQVLSTAITK